MENVKVLQRLEEKLSPHVKNLVDGTSTDHDVFPALLWVLLENEKNLDNQLKNVMAQQAALNEVTQGVSLNNEKVSKNVVEILLQKIEEVKNNQQIIERKLATGSLVSGIFQAVVIILLVLILMRTL